MGVVGAGLGGAFGLMGLSLGSIAGEFLAGGQMADAQSGAAMAQMAMALKVLEMQQQDRQTALGLAEPSPAELNAIATQYQNSASSLEMQMKQIQKDESLLDSVDPALKEAGKQAYEMLQGKEAAVLGPLRNERARQRQSLQSTLRDQLGPGYETSSAGIEALGRFDQQTAAITSEAQQNTLGGLLSLSAGVRPDVAGKTARAYSSAGDLLSSAITAGQNSATRKVNAFTQVPMNYQNIINTATAPYVGDYARAQNLGNIFSRVTQLGGMALGAGLGGGGIGGAGAGAGASFASVMPRMPAVQSSYNSPYFGQIGG